MFRHQEGAPMKTLCERCMTVCRFQGQKNFSMETCRYFHQKAQTVGDKLRAMSDGELAAVIVKAYNGAAALPVVRQEGRLRRRGRRGTGLHGRAPAGLCGPVAGIASEGGQK